MIKPSWLDEDDVINSVDWKIIDDELNGSTPNRDTLIISTNYTGRGVALKYKLCEILTLVKSYTLSRIIEWV